MAKVQFFYKTSTAWGQMTGYTSGALYFVSNGQGSLEVYRAKGTTASDLEKLNKTDIDDINDMLDTMADAISRLQQHQSEIMHIKGDFGTGLQQAALPTTGCSPNDAWRCAVAGTYTVPTYLDSNHTEKLEVGDLCIMIGNSTDVYWTVLQNNVDMSAYVPKSAVMSKGSSTIPVYFNANGEAVACDLSNTYAAKSHTHNYAGSASAGGAANSVKTNLTIKLNGGTTEGTNLFTFNGSSAKTIDITPSAIGASASGHTHTFASLTSKPTTLSGYGITDAKIANGVITLGSNTITPLTSHQSLAGYATEAKIGDGSYDYVTGDIEPVSNNASHIGTVSKQYEAIYSDVFYENGVQLVEKYALTSHTHNYAGSASAGGAANSVKTNLTIKLNGGTTEGTNLFTFNGSSAKTIDITPSAIGAAASGHTHSTSIATSTGTSQITLTHGGKFAITAGGTSYIFTMPASGNTDRYVNSASFADDSTNNNVKMTLTRAGSDTATVTANIPKVSSSSAGVAPKGAAVSSQSQSTKFLREDGTWAAPSYTTNTNTASAVDNILDGSNSGTAITYAPYTAQQSKLSFDTSSTNPTRTDRLNLNGYLYATKLYSGGTEVSVSGHTHSYAGSSSAGGAANSVKTNLIIKFNGGSTEGTNLFTFNGSTAKTIDITPSAIGAVATSDLEWKS